MSAAAVLFIKVERSKFFRGMMSVLFFIGMAATAAGVCADTIRVRADVWAPYNNDPVSFKPGYVVEMLNAIFKPLGHTIDYQTMAWTRAVEEMMSGEADVIIGAAHADAPNALFAAETMGTVKNMFWVSKGGIWQYSGADSLRSVRLGVIAGYTYDDGGPIDAYIKKASDPEVQVMTGDGALERNIKKLQAGRIDTFIENEITVLDTLKQMGLAADELAAAGKADEIKDLFLAFTPNKEETKKYAQIWDDGVKQLRASGELKKILDRYSVNDWKQP
jgi:polar amino acid transport system substrate-binding protein